MRVGLLLFFLLISLPQCAHKHQPVTLNQGQRWQANPETTQGIQTMLKAIDQASAGGEPMDYTTLNIALQTAFQDIFKQCTMTGEAHNQLHNYLLPMKDLFAAVKSSTDQKAAVEKLKAYLQDYGTYFE